MYAKKKFLKLVIVLLVIILLPIHVNAMNAIDAVTPNSNKTTQKNDKNAQSDKAKKEYEKCLAANPAAGVQNCMNQHYAAEKEKKENEEKALGSGYKACQEYVNGLYGGASTGMMSACSKYVSDKTLTEADFKKDFGIKDEVKKENTSEEKGPSLEETSYNIPSTVCGNSIKLPIGLAVITSNAVLLLEIATPIILIILGMIDFFKATASNEKEANSQAGKKLTRRIMSAIIVVLIVTIVQFTFDTLATATGDKTKVTSCINCFINGVCTKA